jgi:hypothetical protein
VARDGGDEFCTCEDANAMVGDRRNQHDGQGRRCHCGNHSETGNSEGNAAVGGEGDGRVRRGVVRTCEDDDAARRGSGDGALGADLRSGGLAAAAVRCGGRTLAKCAGASIRSQVSAASRLLTEARRAEAGPKSARLVAASASGGQKPTRS